MSTPAPRRIVTCTSCGQRRGHESRGWCKPCFGRWDRAGRPASGPPPSRCRRWDEYEELTREMGLTLQQAVDRMRISHRTGQRYENRLAGAFTGQDDD